MKLTFSNTYSKAETANKVHVYGVTGSTEEVEAYIESQGDKVRYADENSKLQLGTPLYFSNILLTDTCTLHISKRGTAYVVNPELEEAKEQVKAIGGNWDDAVKAQSAMIVGNIFAKLGKQA